MNTTTLTATEADFVNAVRAQRAALIAKSKALKAGNFREASAQLNLASRSAWAAREFAASMSNARCAELTAYARQSA